jgi:hypothetical protein
LRSSVRNEDKKEQWENKKDEERQKERKIVVVAVRDRSSQDANK